MNMVYSVCMELDGFGFINKQLKEARRNAGLFLLLRSADLIKRKGVNDYARHNERHEPRKRGR